MVVATTLAVVLVVSTFLFHFAVLRWLSGGMARISMTAGLRILVIVLGTLVAHLVEVGLYTGAYALGDSALGLGALSGRAVAGPLDYFYFSIVSYTSLGLGDVLNGLLLIAWSGSFIYIAVGHLWPWQPCTEPGGVAADRKPGGTAP